MASQSHKHSRIDASKRRREETKTPKGAPQKKKTDLTRLGQLESPLPATQGPSPALATNWEDDDVEDDTVMEFTPYSAHHAVSAPPRPLPVINDLFYTNTTPQKNKLQIQTGHDLFSSPTDSALADWFGNNPNDSSPVLHSQSTNTPEEVVSPLEAPETPIKAVPIASPSRGQPSPTNVTVSPTPRITPPNNPPASSTTPDAPTAAPNVSRTPQTQTNPHGTPPAPPRKEQVTPVEVHTPSPAPPPNPATTPANPGAKATPPPATNADPPGTKEEGDIASLLKSLEEQSSLAELENAFGAFSLVATPFSEIKIPMEVDDPMSYANKSKGIQWIKLTVADCSPVLLHKSGNPHDFISDTTLEECKKAIRGEKNKLGNTKAILVDPGYKMIVHIVHRNCPHTKHQPWIKHAIRSALASAESPLEGAMSIIAMGKISYDWHVISLTKEALREIRALFDPRSRVLALLRLWKMEPEATQILNFTGVISESDLNETARTAATRLFKEQLEPTLTPWGISITKTETIPNPRNPVAPPITSVTFKLAGQTIFTLNPKDLPKAYTGPEGRPHTIAPSWPKRCNVCHSESHLEEKICPWTTKEFNGATFAPYNANNLSPGQTERAPKRKRDDTEATAPGVTMLTDIRPITRMTKKRKTEASNDMDIDQPNPTPPVSATTTAATTTAPPTVTTTPTPATPNTTTMNAATTV